MSGRPSAVDSAIPLNPAESGAYLAPTVAPRAPAHAHALLQTTLRGGILLERQLSTLAISQLNYSPDRPHFPLATYPEAAPRKTLDVDRISIFVCSLCRLHGKGVCLTIYLDSTDSHHSLSTRSLSTRSTQTLSRRSHSPNSDRSLCQTILGSRSSLCPVSRSTLALCHTLYLYGKRNYSPHTGAVC